MTWMTMLVLKHVPHCEVQAAWVMKRYIENLDDPFACNLEVMGSFGQQMQLGRSWLAAP